jgi:dihydrolipoamide dehydrogenase
MPADVPDGYDVLVLGGGSGGYACALRSAQLGLRVALIERDKLGGTCLHRGCIPTKALLHAAEVADTARDGARFGVNSSVASIDMPAVLRYQQGVVSRLHKGLQGLVSAATIDYFPGVGEVTSPTTIRLGDTTLTGRNLVLATGSRARSLPGLEIGGRVLTSDEALTLDVVPGSVIVLGGGVIGVEFASVFRSFGASVTIVEALPRLVPAEEDEAISKALERAFRKRGITVSRTGARFSGRSPRTSTRVSLTLEDGATFECRPVARGRRARSGDRGSGLRGGRHRPSDRGFVPTDERLRTGVDERVCRGRPRPGPAVGAPQASPTASSSPRRSPGSQPTAGARHAAYRR